MTTMPEYPPFSLASLLITELAVSFFIILRYFMIAGFFYWALWQRPAHKVHARRVAYLLLSVPLYMFLHDTYFYWTHRAMHHPKIFPIVHQVHHESRQPTPWAGFSFHWTEAIVGALILPVLVQFIPIHVGALIFLLVLMTVLGITNHAGWELLPDRWLRGFVGRHWISATHHNVHHQKFRTNFALYFRFWDRLMQTDEMEVPD